jgi:streptogramin lyase
MHALLNETSLLEESVSARDRTSRIASPTLTARIPRIPEYSRGAVAAFDPATGTFDEIPFPLADALPYVARVDPGSGAVWVGTGAAGVVARVDPVTREAELVPLPSREPLLRHLAIDPRTGAVWGAASPFPPRGPLVFRITPR